MLLNKHDLANNAWKFLMDTQIGDRNLWAKLVDQYRRKTDGKGQYKGEYWGKIMRGAALICKYTETPDLYATLENTVRDMISVCNDEGLSSYKTEFAFTGWDIWCRKYVAVGLEYFYDICRSEELKKQILDVIDIHLSAIIRHIGSGPDKKEICLASENWGGLNSCSILKAYVVAYKLTGKQKFLDFAEYIVSTGGSKDFDYLQAAKDDVLPLNAYRYPKAYECTSFFEGLLEYARVKNDAEIIRACFNYGNSLLKEEFTVTGSGATNCECFSYSSNTQTKPQKLPEQETCVTVSYMLYFYELYKQNGDHAYMDAIETSFYNAYLGALNQTAPKKTAYLPIDWYSPLVGGKRSNIITGGRQTFSDRSIYSCCTAMGPAGLGVFLDSSAKSSDNSIRFDHYISKTYKCGNLTVCEQTDYPVSETVTFDIGGTAQNTDLFFRIPVWCADFSLSINNIRQPVSAENGYVKISDTFKSGDKIVLEFRMPYTYSFMTAADFNGGFLCFKKGPFLLAADRRYTAIFTSFRLNRMHEPDFDFEFKPYNNNNAICSVKVKCKNKQIVLVDYASAGDDYSCRSTLNVFVPYRTANVFNIINCYFDRHKLI